MAWPGTSKGLASAVLWPGQCCSMAWPGPSKDLASAAPWHGVKGPIRQWQGQDRSPRLASVSGHFVQPRAVEELVAELRKWIWEVKKETL